MNVIVSNRQKDIIDNANIDAIKDLNGLFNVSDLINKFKNYFFSKMILDATSVVDFASKDVLTTLANEIGPEKLIILLPSTPEPPLEFKKLLIDLKIYNFTNNIEDVIKFIEKSNTYDDAIKMIDDSFNDNVYVDNSIKEGEEPTEEEPDNTSDSNDNSDYDVDTSEEETSDDTSSTIVENHPSTSSLGDILNNLYVESAVSNQVNRDDESKSVNAVDESKVEPNFASAVSSEEKSDEVDTVNESMNGKNTFLITDDFINTNLDSSKEEPERKIIGIKNVTSHAGSTSLIYMLHKMATVNLKKEVLSVEVNKSDFRLFRDKKMISVKENELTDVVNNSHDQIVFIDLNDCNDTSVCNEVLYLVEPSTIKLNELMATNREIFKELKGKKVLLNKSLLSPNDIRTLESEAGIEFVSNIEPLNDRIFNDSINKLLGIIGIKQ